ncbi:MAG: hypothetical protein SF162_09145 [bacterium]|nr:hypothetical protein [bacterium]
MVYPGQRIENPVTGEIWELITTSAQANAPHVQMTWTVKPERPIPFPHLHPAFDERIDVLHGGEMRVAMHGKTHIVYPNGRITIPRNTPHQAYNPSILPLVCRVTYTPAGPVDQVIETLGWMAGHGYVNKRGMPPLLALIVLAEAFPGAYATTRMTTFSPAVLRGLAFIGRMSGFRAHYGGDKALPERASRPKR